MTQAYKQISAKFAAMPKAEEVKKYAKTIIETYTSRSAHLAIPKKDQKLFNAFIFNENKISRKLPHINTIK